MLYCPVCYEETAKSDFESLATHFLSDSLKNDGKHVSWRNREHILTATHSNFQAVVQSILSKVEDQCPCFSTQQEMICNISPPLQMYTLTTRD